MLLYKYQKKKKKKKKKKNNNNNKFDILCIYWIIYSSIGGPIRKLCIDPTGQRLVVNFEERDNPGCELLGLFSILRKPYLRYQLM